MTEERGDHFVKSFERGLAVLRAFSAERPELTLTKVAEATGLTRAGARRFLLTLVDLGYLQNGPPPSDRSTTRRACSRVLTCLYDMGSRAGRIS